MHSFHTHLLNMPWKWRLGFRTPYLRRPLPQRCKKQKWRSWYQNVGFLFPGISGGDVTSRGRIFFPSESGTKQGACPGQGRCLWSLSTHQRSENPKMLYKCHQMIISISAQHRNFQGLLTQLAVPCPSGAPWLQLGGEKYSPSLTASFQMPFSPKVKIRTQSWLLSFRGTAASLPSRSPILIYFHPWGETGTFPYTIIQIWESFWQNVCLRNEMKHHRK